MLKFCAIFGQKIIARCQSKKKKKTIFIVISFYRLHVCVNQSFTFQDVIHLRYIDVMLRHISAIFDDHRQCAKCEETDRAWT